MGDRVTVGRVSGPHGIRGEVRVFPLTDFPERWQRLHQAYIGAESVPRRVSLRGFARGQMPILQIDGVSTRDAAEQLRGLEIQVPGDEVQPLPPDTYYLFQLEGLRAEDTEGNLLGRVAAVETNPANDVLVVALPDGRQARVPAVREFVRAVDLAEGRVVLRLIPGMVE